MFHRTYSTVMWTVMSACYLLTRQRRRGGLLYFNAVRHQIEKSDPRIDNDSFFMNGLPVWEVFFGLDR